MKKIMVVFAVLSLSACSSMKYTTGVEFNAPKFGADTVSAPDWYTTKGEDGNAIYGVASELSTDMQFAVDKAMMSAKRELASNFSSHIDSLMKDYSAQAGGNDSIVLQEINRTTKLTISRVNLIGVQRTNFRVDREGNGYRAYVKVRYSADDSNKILLDEIRRNQKLNHKFESSKAFKELEDSVKPKEEVTIKPKEQDPVKPKSAEVGVLDLIDVENEEYKKRRAEALDKPGAVHGRVTLR